VNRELDRRRVLVSGAALAAAPVLAACGAEDAATPSPTGSPSPDGGGGGGATSGGAGDALFPTSDVPVGSGVIDADRQVVVTQPVEGEFKAFSSICTHQGCPVTEVSDGEIRCPCHFSRFSVEDGSVVSGPAESPLPEVSVTVVDDQVVLD
jgi:Rieske Fe-S protein